MFVVNGGDDAPLEVVLDERVFVVGEFIVDCLGAGGSQLADGDSMVFEVGMEGV